MRVVDLFVRGLSIIPSSSSSLSFPGRKNKNKVLRRKIFRETFWLFFFYFWTFLFLFPRFFALLCFSCLIAGDAQGKYESFPSFYPSLFRALLSLSLISSHFWRILPHSLYFLPFGPRFIIFHLRLFLSFSQNKREEWQQRSASNEVIYIRNNGEKNWVFFYVIEFPIRSTFSHDCSLARSFVLARLVYLLFFLFVLFNFDLVGLYFPALFFFLCSSLSLSFFRNKENNHESGTLCTHPSKYAAINVCVSMYKYIIRHLWDRADHI